MTAALRRADMAGAGGTEWAALAPAPARRKGQTRRRLSALALLLAVGGHAHAATIYLCKAYQGGLFWSSQHCGKHTAFIERMDYVPDNMPFEHQVEIARQQRAEALRRAAPPPDTSGLVVIGKRTPPPQCQSLTERVIQLDAMARQGRSAQGQEAIRIERDRIRRLQFELKC